MLITLFVLVVKDYQICSQRMQKRNLYTHNNNIFMDQIKKLCTAANLLVEMESSFCFNDRTNKRMDLVVKLNDKDFLIVSLQ